MEFNENTWYSLKEDTNRIFPVDAPTADVVDLQKDPVTNLILEDYDFTQCALEQTGNNFTIDQCQVMKRFTPVDKNGDNFETQINDYGDWLADFIIILKDDFYVGSGGICGYYDTFGSWVFIEIGEMEGYPGYNSEEKYFSAGTEFSLMWLLSIALDYEFEGIPYSFIIDFASKGDSFICGAFNYSDDNIEKTLEVQLRLYEPVDNKKGDNYILCNKIICKYDNTHVISSQTE